MAVALNDRQEAFCQQLVSGASQRQAYLFAYPKSKSWKDTTVDARASKLAAEPKIKNRLEELRKQAAASNAITRDDLIAELKVIGFAQTSGRVIPRDKIRALEVMAKILGFDQAQTGSGSIEDLTIIAELLSIPDGIEDGQNAA
jgi:hypothetical protein